MTIFDRGLHADEDTSLDRRAFLRGVAATAVGAAAVGTIPATALAQAPAVPAPAAPAAAAPAAPAPFSFPGKNPELVVLGDNPLNVETPAHLLDDDVTPYANFFIRTHGTIPELPANPDAWEITVDGEVNTPMTITLADLKSRFENVTLFQVLECAGNGRAFFVPAASGNQWTHGAVGCAQWTGVRVRDVLNAAGVKASAVYTAHYGSDAHLSGDPTRIPLSRGVPIAKALDENSLIAFAMNGEPLQQTSGGPVRLLYPGYPGSASQKWLTRIWVRDVVHDGPGMTGLSYKAPITPIVPGTPADKIDPANFATIVTMPIRSLITSPATGTTLPAGTRSVALRGAAWAGEGQSVEAVELSADGGKTWHAASLGGQRNAYDWKRWTAEVPVPTDGYYEIWTRATDANGAVQPYVATNWNPSGYGGNRMHEIAVLIG